MFGFIIQIAKVEMFRYLAEPRNILAEPLGSPEPRLKNTALVTNYSMYKKEIL